MLLPDDEGRSPTGGDRVLTGLVVGTRLPIVSADAGWRGVTRGAGGARRWWALAIGHVPAGAGPPAVTFTRGRPGSRHARRTTVRPAPMGGLWVAAVFGRYTTVRCQLTSLGPECVPGTQFGLEQEELTAGNRLGLAGLM